MFLIWWFVNLIVVLIDCGVNSVVLSFLVLLLCSLHFMFGVWLYNCLFLV